MTALPLYWTDRDAEGCRLIASDLEADRAAAEAAYGCRLCQHWNSMDGETGECEGPELSAGTTGKKDACEQFDPWL